MLLLGKPIFMTFKDSITVRAIQRNLSTLFSLQQERDYVIDYIEKLAKSVNACSLSIYLSIPGIAKITAIRLVAELGDLRRFDTSAQIDAFVGIDPGRYQSGEKDSSLGIPKHDNHIVRKILYRTITQMETVELRNLVILLIITIRKNDLQIAKAIRRSPLHQPIN